MFNWDRLLSLPFGRDEGDEACALASSDAAFDHAGFVAGEEGVDL